MNKILKFNIGDKVKGHYKHKEIVGTITSILDDDPNHDYVITSSIQEGNYYASESELEAVDIKPKPKTRKYIVIPVDDDLLNGTCDKCPFNSFDHEFNVEYCGRGINDDNKTKCNIESMIRELPNEGGEDNE